MWSIATDGVACSITVSQLATFVCPAKANKPIEMPHGWVTRVGPKY